MAIRNLDKSDDIRSLLDCVYQVYDLENIPYERSII